MTMLEVWERYCRRCTRLARRGRPLRLTPQRYHEIATALDHKSRLGIGEYLFGARIEIHEENA